ncbi:MAG: hypothetical protein IJ508_05555, partial [Oscillospiraceae bacterium]|nr:hypothetical protein [Oscillospiraceae bacterium]
MELLNAQNREEYEAFVLAHPAGEFTQSLRWPQVKNNWGYEAILSRGKDGALRGPYWLYYPLFWQEEHAVELLTAQNREEYEAFVLAHPAGEFTQSLR